MLELALEDEQGRPTEHPGLSFAIGDPSVASVDSAGRVTGRAEGETLVSVTAGELLATCVVRVTSALGRVGRATALVLVLGASGSAFVIGISEGRTLLVTNAHVLVPPGGKRSWGVDVVFEPGTSAESRPLRAEILGSDRKNDLALLAVTEAEPRPSRASLPLARACDIKSTFPAWVAGYPFGISLGVGEQYPSVSINAGKATRRSGPGGSLVIDVGINPGNSGGPVVDAAGTVLGVAVAHVPGTRKSFAVPCEAVEQFLADYAPTLQPVRKEPIDTPVPGSGVAVDEAPAARGRLPEPEPEAERVRAMALFVTASGRGSGFVAGRGGDNLVVLTADVEPVRVLVNGRIDVVLAGPEKRERSGRLLALGPNAAAIAVPVPRATPDHSRLVLLNKVPGVGARVNGTAFHPGRSTEQFALVRREGTVTGVRARPGTEMVAELQVDFGIYGAVTGGVVFDEEGSGAIGLLARRASADNIGRVIPTAELLNLMQNACSRLRQEAGAADLSGMNNRTAEAQRAFDVAAGVLRGGGAGAVETAARAFEKNCERNHAESCRSIAYAYLRGLGVQTS